MNPGTLIVVAAAVFVFGSVAKEIFQCILRIRDMNREIGRLKRRKQDWTPREDPALWRRS